MLYGAGLVFALAVTPTSRALAPAGQVNAGPSASAASKMGPMDINTASIDQLRTLPGIGDTYAGRIVKGRPYTSKNQLVTKGILPKNVYAKVQNMIIASHVRK
jgi:DNA uptake protein ComE-like DNA-binding protein